MRHSGNIDGVQDARASARTRSSEYARIQASVRIGEQMEQQGAQEDGTMAMQIMGCDDGNGE